MRKYTEASEQIQFKELCGASDYQRQCEVHTSVSLSIKSKSRLKYRCIATSKVRNEKDKKLEKTHCEVMLFSFEGMTSKEKIR